MWYARYTDAITMIGRDGYAVEYDSGGHAVAVKGEKRKYLASTMPEGSTRWRWLDERPVYSNEG
jgi:hypothetical protein